MHLSEHFTLDEFIVSQTAARHSIDNSPPPHVIENLRYVAQRLEGIRTLLKTPIIVSSGYRCPELNARVGGSKTSQHMLGQAADWTAPGFGNPKEIVAYLHHVGVQYDQMILEFNAWVHTSFVRDGSRQQALIIDSSGTRTYA